MTVRVAVRLSLPDRPGMLAAVAGQVAEADGNVLGLEVLESDDGSAVDELTIELADTDHVDTLCRSLRYIEGTDIEEVREIAPDAEERGLQVLSAGVAILETTNTSASLTAMTGLIKELFSVEWSALIDLRTESYFQTSGDAPEVESLMTLIKRNREESVAIWVDGFWVIIGELAESGLALGIGRTIQFRRRERREFEMLVRITDRMCRPLRGDRIPAGWG